MRSINLKKPNVEGTIARELIKATGGARRHTLRSATDVYAIVREVQGQLDNQEVGIRDRIGAQIVYRGSGARTQAYSYSCIVSKLVFRIGSDGRTIHLTHVSRDKAYPGQKRELKIQLTASGFSHWLQQKAARFGVLGESLAGRRSKKLSQTAPEHPESFHFAGVDLV